MGWEGGLWRDSPPQPRRSRSEASTLVWPQRQNFRAWGVWAQSPRHLLEHSLRGKAQSSPQGRQRRDTPAWAEQRLTPSAGNTSPWMTTQPLPDLCPLQVARDTTHKTREKDSPTVHKHPRHPGGRGGDPGAREHRPQCE